MCHVAHRRGVPFVTLTSKPALRPLYESCGFTVVSDNFSLARMVDPVWAG